MLISSSLVYVDCRMMLRAWYLIILKIFLITNIVEDLSMSATCLSPRSIFHLIWQNILLLIPSSYLHTLLPNPLSSTPNLTISNQVVNCITTYWMVLPNRWFLGDSSKKFLWSSSLDGFLHFLFVFCFCAGSFSIASLLLVALRMVQHLLLCSVLFSSWWRLPIKVGCFFFFYL